eukprot:TRINITY_DN6928_c0_g1_i1.p1 TRINITY_DN6928_c0_g1~~TRINITY_DN6928_c0_g1_i1.p1  ORF type:complete len:116 (+),score=10.45 TRINITY_DN6928_c0_g1_i1:1313-1660(+)
MDGGSQTPDLGSATLSRGLHMQGTHCVAVVRPTQARGLNVVLQMLLAAEVATASSVYFLSGPGNRPAFSAMRQYFSSRIVSYTFDQGLYVNRGSMLSISRVRDQTLDGKCSKRNA